MKKFNNDLELLSSYLDGELSQSEKRYIEEKIKTSLELQRELSELRKLKDLTSVSIERISESPFFEARVMASLTRETGSGFSYKKWIPAFAITVLTIGLMVLLKYNPHLIEDLIEEQKSNIAGFYKENLQPLLYAANLTNDDIFNFALYQELPLDSTNQQILKLGYDARGDEYFEIKKLSNIQEVPPPVNLKQFVDVLDLDERETRQIDSIISSYSDQVSGLVLVNDQNAVAINPNIWNTRKAILADILSFAQSRSSDNLSRLIPEETIRFNDKSLVTWVNETKNKKSDQYIFCTPDSVFRDNFEFDMTEFKEDMKKMEIELRRLDKENRKIRDFTFYIKSDSIDRKEALKMSRQFQIFADSNLLKVTVQNLNIPDFRISEFNIPDFDSIAFVIQEATKNIVTVRPPVPPDAYDRKRYNYDSNTSFKNKKKKTEINLDSLMNIRNIITDSIYLEQMKKLDLLKESQKDGMQFNFNDSLIWNHNRELKKEMDNLKNELRRFREEIKNYEKKSIEKDSNSIKEIKNSGVKVIEI